MVSWTILLDDLVSKMRNSSFSLAYIPWQAFMTVEPIEQILAAPAESVHSLTSAWKEAKLQELSIVALASALIAGVCASAFSWNNMAPQPYIVRGAWYSALLLSLVSITIAVQQGLALSRLLNSPDGMRRLRSLLSYVHAGHAKPRYLQVFIWQTPVMLMNVSIGLFVIGLGVLVFNSVVDKSEDVRTGVLFSVAAVFGLSTYVVSTTSLYWRAQLPEPP